MYEYNEYLDMFRPTKFHADKGKDMVERVS